ncbi:HTTM domain-containing protein [Hyalangium rubrum]|uniref:HTTM domain-containing protein n=1 Tax=Hyalangium rubrum TaxID=3103134 RepID=A0ABU5GVC2_9BACT|nr:HTTM domain-containing protein [Hyalangium sp. s54d21]MDY7225120.1 HTTM domain-containing protein [Hyalangium sp. s54d21]
MSLTHRLRAHVHRALFEQNEPLTRLALMRIALGLVTVAYVVLEPYHRFLLDTRELLYSPSPLFAFVPPLDRTGLWVLEGATVVAGILFTLGYRTRAAAIAFSVLFAVWNYYVACFSRPTWVYNTHLNFFLWALCFCPAGARWSLDARRRSTAPGSELSERQLASFGMAFMQLYIAVLYFQAGLSKVLNSGFVWFILGQTPLIQTAQVGTEFGMQLTRVPELFTAFNLYAGVLEFGFLPATLLLGRVPRPMALMAILFHVGVGLTMKVSFWHLFLLYPALFLYQALPAKQPAPLTEPDARPATAA